MPKIRARYVVKGPKKEQVTFTKATMEPVTKSMQLETVTEERECFMVLFPQGHSIRVTSRDKLKELGYHLKPRMVDMDTGDVIETGGDPYDFANNVDLGDVTLVDEEDDTTIDRKRPSRGKE